VQLRAARREPHPRLDRHRDGPNQNRKRGLHVIVPARPRRHCPLRPAGPSLPVVTSSAVWVGTSASTLVALSPASGAVLSTITLPGIPGGGGQYSGDPSDIGIGNNVLVVPTGSTVTAFG
jgi:hypothetical protein